MLKHKSTAVGLSRLLVGAIAVLALLSACVPATPAASTPQPTLDPDEPVSSDDPTATPSQTPRPGQFRFGENAIVEEIDVLILESFPVQVNALVRGQLPDGCTVIDRTEVERDEDTFHIRIITRRPADAFCTEALVPFEHSVSLDVFGLPAGEYTVQAYEVSAAFTLDVDNILPTDAAQVNCLHAAGGQPVYSDEVSGYCFAYPLDFEAIVPEGPVDVIVRGPQYGEGPQPLAAEVVIGTMRRAGRSLEDFIGEITGLGDASEIQVERQDILLGGEPAVVLDNMPGAGPNRLVVSAHGESLYTLTFQPLEAAGRPEIRDDLLRLYEQMVATWSWLQVTGILEGKLAAE